jgi:AcrR family transcriptional regulator
LKQEKEAEMTKIKYSLREKKYAKTKIALAKAFLERLKSTRFADISIKEVCNAVEVSEGTFYNYFSNKIELARYFERLTLLKVAWELQKKEQQLEPLEMIEYAFDLMAIEINQPFLFYEMVSLFTAERVKLKEGQALTGAEKYFAFPECNDIEKVKVVTIENLFSEVIAKAQKKGTISKKIRTDDILTNLMAILIGVPLAIEIEDFDKINRLYRSQLALLWKAVKIDKRKL